MASDAVVLSGWKWRLRARNAARTSSGAASRSTPSSCHGGIARSASAPAVRPSRATSASSFAARFDTAEATGAARRCRSCCGKAAAEPPPPTAAAPSSSAAASASSSSSAASSLCAFTFTVTEAVADVPAEMVVREVTVVRPPDAATIRCVPPVAGGGLGLGWGGGATHSARHTWKGRPRSSADSHPSQTA